MIIDHPDRARRAGKALVKACRERGEDVRLFVGLHAAASALGFATWDKLVRLFDRGSTLAWSDDRCRSRFLKLVPDMDRQVLDEAIASVHQRFSRWGSDADRPPPPLEGAWDPDDRAMGVEVTLASLLDLP